MSKDTGNNLYQSGAYARHNPAWHREDSPWKARKIIEAIPEDVLKELPHSIRIVDIGCGVGEILKLVSEFFHKRGLTVEAHGYDISSEAISHARIHFPAGIFHQSEFTPREWEKNGRTIDITLMIDILEHLERPGKLLSEAGAVSRYCICHIPLEDNVEVRLRGLRRRFKNTVGHLHSYTEKNAVRLLEENGFSIERINFTCLDYDADYRMKSLPRRLIAQPLRRIFFKRHPGFTAQVLGNCSLMAFLTSKTRLQE